MQERTLQSAYMRAASLALAVQDERYSFPDSPIIEELESEYETAYAEYLELGGEPVESEESAES